MSSRRNQSFEKPDVWVASKDESLALRALSLVASRVAVGRDGSTADWTSRLAEAALAESPARLAAMEQTLRESRVPNDHVVDTLIPEAVRAVGLCWDTDRAGFARVTIASARLQGMLRDLTRRHLALPWSTAHGIPRSVLVVVPEGEQHTMGALVAASQLARSGFDAVLSLSESRTRLRTRLRAERFAAVCLSLSRRETLENARDLVETVRMGCGYPVAVMIGGAAVNGRDHIGEETGADAITNDLHEALRLCGLTISMQGEGRSAIKA